MKTSELTGAALDWAVAKCEELNVSRYKNIGRFVYTKDDETIVYFPSENWSQGGPIIDREGIDLYCNVATKPEHSDPAWRGSWRACYHSMGRRSEMFYGETALISAMRCYVASKLGDEVEIPEELL